MVQKKIDEQLKSLPKTKYLLYREIATEKLKKTDEEFKTLSDKNDQLYYKNKLINMMSDGNELDKSMIIDDVLNDLVMYHQNLLLLYDSLLMEFYYMGKKDLFYEFKKTGIL